MKIAMIILYIVVFVLYVAVCRLAKYVFEIFDDITNLKLDIISIQEILKILSKLTEGDE